MTVPDGNAPLPRGLEDYVRKLERRVAALEQKPATNLGRFSVRDPDGDLSVYIGPDDTTFVRPDGLPQNRILFYRDNGQMFFGTQGDYYGPDMREYWYFLDSTGAIVASDDANTGRGLANPWMSIPMYPKFMPSASTTAATKWIYMTLAASAINTETQLWEAYVPRMTHPRVEMALVYGVASGSASPTYNIKVNGDTLDSWTQSTLTVGLNPGGPIDVTPYMDFPWAHIEVTAQAAGTTPQIACQVLGCALRQS